MKKTTLAVVAAVALSRMPAVAGLVVHVQPDAGTPVIGEWPDDMPVQEVADAEGWAPVVLSGPHVAWVANRDIGKDLEIEVGASFRVEPRADAAVLTTMSPGDVVRIEKVVGDWSQVSLSEGLPGYVRLASPGGAGGEAPAGDVTGDPVVPADVPRGADRPGGVADGRPAVTAPAVVEEDRARLPRVFQGTFKPTRKILGFGPAYPWQIVTAEGRRIALLDLRALMVTEDLSRYVGRTVEVRGRAAPTANGRDFVVIADSLVLR